MPRIAPLFAAAALFALPSQADETTGSQLRAGLEKLGARLALTAEQEAQARSIFEEHLKAQIATLEKYDVDAGDRGDADTVNLQQMRALRAELRASRAEIESRLSKVLSKAQIAEFKRIRAEQEATLRERILSRHLDEFGAKLDLSPKQADRTRPVLKDHFEAQMAILDRHGIAPGHRDGGKRPGFRTLRRLRKDLKKNNARTAKQLSVILSEAQLAAYEALQREQRKKLRALLSER